MDTWFQVTLVIQMGILIVILGSFKMHFTTMVVVPKSDEDDADYWKRGNNDR